MLVVIASIFIYNFSETWFKKRRKLTQTDLSVYEWFFPPFGFNFIYFRLMRKACLNYLGKYLYRYGSVESPDE